MFEEEEVIQGRHTWVQWVDAATVRGVHLPKQVCAEAAETRTPVRRLQSYAKTLSVDSVK